MGARNPKVLKISVNLADEVNRRLEQLADKSGMNKSTIAAMCVAAGLEQLEVPFKQRGGGLAQKTA